MPSGGVVVVLEVVVVELVLGVVVLLVVVELVLGAVDEPLVLVEAGVVVLLVVVELPEVPEGRFGYVGVAQHALWSACGPLWGALSKVMAMRPPALYAGERSMAGTTERRKFSVAVAPAFGLAA